MINWKVRFKNAAFVSALLGFIVSTVFQLLTMFEIAPSITEDSVMRLVAACVQVLTLMGVLIDPTTKGVSDSERAMNYEEPN